MDRVVTVWKQSRLYDDHLHVPTMEHPRTRLAHSHEHRTARPKRTRVVAMEHLDRCHTGIEDIQSLPFAAWHGSASCISPRPWLWAILIAQRCKPLSCTKAGPDTPKRHPPPHLGCLAPGRHAFGYLRACVKYIQMLLRPTHYCSKQLPACWSEMTSGQWKSSITYAS
ncbi:hypothetical protein BU24DRAFT_27592 [Aaosphaeria arxii CBS 175.79]|uniref:Uncharacterized protein n=1 Tax=Aaosphaeria arxii CBS 175.79 TaxID=1450172 RepID=A0A6A5Y917_9PLEO|nr:uncharacterized protein BU24DRAFT_27592 [Aaosphaeria arxii CBS 175.79]KAF2021746.1 hypothetical protein BU24DRAFT_27592 [Aaosphaeria arxii CBS 175.79]